MNLFQKKESKKQIESNNKKRVLEQAYPDVEQAINYTSLFEEGLMHIVEDEYSMMFKLGDVDYEVSTEEEQLDVVMGYAEGLNTLDKNSRYQLLVMNKAISSKELDETLLVYQADSLDDYRQEINDIIIKQYEHDQRNFEIEKYCIFTTKARSMKQAKKNLEMMSKNFKNRFDANEVDLTLTKLSGIERLKILSSILRPEDYFSTSYQDIAISGLSSKAFICPSRLLFPKNKSYYRLGERFATTLYIKQYPKYLEDILIKELCNIGIELAISVQATPYDMINARKHINQMQTLNDVAISKQQKQNFNDGVSENLLSGEVKEIRESTKSLLDEIKDNGQKLYSGIFAVHLSTNTEEELIERIKQVQDVGETWQVLFEPVSFYKEEAMNTILPIGKPYLDVELNYMRDMTTTNIATQVPLSNIELQSPTGQFYGKNQRTNNMISIDRKKDLITPSGMIFGTSGSGKGMTTKWEILSTKLKYPDDRFIIVDPESEYLPIAKEFGAEILDISTGTKHHLNILDMADDSLLDEEDRNVDLVKEKANLLSSLFESLLQHYTDTDASIVDRVTRLLYAEFEGRDRQPTLVDWYELLLEQPEESAKILAGKVESYTVGSQDIFAYETNIDLTSNFIVFNIKQLDDRLKPFAMKVILDQIWKQVVAGQGKVTTHLYFDELQLNFDTEANAQWFTSLWSRIRKYGAIPTGITQNVSTLLDSQAGRKMISNSEFLVLLRQKPVDLNRLQEMIRLTPKLMNYIGDRVPQGTGLISSGGIVVPFENPIPKNTQLFSIMNTDA